MTRDELDKWKVSLKVGDLVWYVDDSDGVSVRRIVAVDQSLGLDLQPVKGSPSYTLSNHYQAPYEKPTRACKYSYMWPYPEGRDDIRRHLNEKARQLRDDANDVGEFEDTYWMTDELAVEVVGKTYAEVMAAQREE